MSVSLKIAYIPKSGTYAPPANASYNAGNELTQFGSSGLTFDANGNLLSDGTNAYTWNARNELVSISGGASASFNYDAIGRRISKTIGAATTGYLYDGPNPIEELSGSGISASMLTGPEMDEYFQRTDSSGTLDYLTDGLGSTVALTSPTGGTIASYTYDPYGGTAVTGSSRNPYQFTGRENDGTGLYFYRARYYDASHERFLGEDPVTTFGAEPYLYVRDAPANYTDPTGEIIKVCSRAGWNNLMIPGGVANHSYIVDTRNGHNCGMGGQNGKEDPNAPGTGCAEVPGSAGHEQQVMDCCKWRRETGEWRPFKNDCHTVVADCLKMTHLPPTPAPGERWGRRCDNSVNCIPGPWFLGPPMYPAL